MPNTRKQLRFKPKTIAALKRMSRKELRTLLDGHDKTLDKLLKLNHLGTPAYRKMSSSNFRKWSNGFHERDRLFTKIDREIKLGEKIYSDKLKKELEENDF